MSHLKYTALTPELYAYTLDILGHESPSLTVIHEKNQEHPQIQMQISPDEAHFLQFLIRSKKAKRILEIGTFLGYSSAAMAEALGNDGKLITCDVDARSAAQAKSHWEYANLTNKIELKLAPALETMQNLIAEQQFFDFIFIDADKNNSIAYYELAKQLLTCEGIIAVDNIFFHGEVCLQEPSKAALAMHECNLHVQQDKSVSFSIIPIADGLMLIQLK